MQVMQQSESESLRHVRRRHSCVSSFGARRLQQAQRKASLLGDFLGCDFVGNQSVLAAPRLLIMAPAPSHFHWPGSEDGPETRSTVYKRGHWTSGGAASDPLDKITCTDAMLLRLFNNFR